LAVEALGYLKDREACMISLQRCEISHPRVQNAPQFSANSQRAAPTRAPAMPCEPVHSTLGLPDAPSCVLTLSGTASGRGSITTLIRALGFDGVGCSMLVDEPVNGDIYEAFVERVLCPQIRTGDVVVMDHLPSHKVAGVRNPPPPAFHTQRLLAAKCVKLV
jgi:hypothetical protein